MEALKGKLLCHSAATNLRDQRKGLFVPCSQLEFAVSVLSNWIDVRALKEVNYLAEFINASKLIQSE